MLTRFIRRRSFGTQLAALMAIAVTVVALALTAIITSMMQAQIERDKGAALAAVGRSVTAGLGKNIRDRIQQVEQLVGSEDLWDKGLGSDKVRHALQRMKQLRPVPAWVGVADLDGRVLAATDDLLVGRVVKERPWFEAGLRGVYVSDAHLAKLLASLLRAPANGEPLRFIDFSAPIKVDGRTVGVAALHADLQALEAIAATFLPKSAVARHVEVYVMSRSGEVVYGPDRTASIDIEGLAAQVAALPPLQPGEQARPAVDIFWGDGEQYLTTSWALDEYTPGVQLGWRVLVRQPVEIAYAPARVATQRALVGALAAAVVAVGFGLLLGRQLTVPMRRIAAAARDVKEGKAGAFVGEFNQNRELVQLSSALQAMTERLEGMVQERTQQLNAANDELRALGEQQQAMLDNELVGIVRMHMASRTSIWTNQAMCKIFGYSSDELNHQPSRMLYADDATHARVGQEARSAFDEGREYLATVQMLRRDGTRIWIHLQGSPLKTRPGESLWMMTDVTAQHLYQEQVEHIAFHDALTGLPNRLLLADRVGQAAANAVRTGHLAAVAYLDLDGFKAINDTHGHEAGDQLLKEVAKRMEACVRAGDTVARMGGDEFVFVLCGLTDKDQCNIILQRVLHEICKPVSVLGGREVAVSGSIGVALCPTNFKEPRDLMNAADGAMYAAKRAGKRCISYTAA